MLVGVGWGTFAQSLQGPPRNRCNDLEVLQEGLFGRGGVGRDGTERLAPGLQSEPRISEDEIAPSGTCLAVGRVQFGRLPNAEARRRDRLGHPLTLVPLGP